MFKVDQIDRLLLPARSAVMISGDPRYQVFVELLVDLNQALGPDMRNAADDFINSSFRNSGVDLLKLFSKPDTRTTSRRLARLLSSCVSGSSLSPLRYSYPRR